MKSISHLIYKLIRKLIYIEVEIQRRYIIQNLKKCGNNLYIGERTYFTGFKNIELGNNVRISNDSKILAPENSGKIIIGDNFECNFNVFLCANDNRLIKIGNDVLIGPNVVLRTDDHKFDSLHIPINLQGHRGGDIIIENDVWVGANAVITKNVNIGKHAIVGAGAIVTKNVEAYSIVGGVPAKKIGTRK